MIIISLAHLSFCQHVNSLISFLQISSSKVTPKNVATSLMISSMFAAMHVRIVWNVPVVQSMIMVWTVMHSSLKKLSRKSSMLSNLAMWLLKWYIEAATSFGSREQKTFLLWSCDLKVIWQKLNWQMSLENSWLRHYRKGLWSSFFIMRKRSQMISVKYQ